MGLIRFLIGFILLALGFTMAVTFLQSLFHVAGPMALVVGVILIIVALWIMGKKRPKL